MTLIEELKSQVANLEGRVAQAETERKQAWDAVSEFAREAKSIVAGEMEGDAGIAWTNLERAEADAERADAAYEALRDELFGTAFDLACEEKEAA